MNKERYKFPLFDIVDGCPRTLDREMIGDIPDNINKIVLEGKDVGAC